MATRGDRHLRAIQLARQLAALGARLKTIHLITGIPPRQAQTLFFPDARSIPRGRAPDSAEWYYGANLILRIDACLVGVRYRQLRRQGIAAGEALVLAYRAYQAVTLPPYRISLDRAFNLVCHIDGIWLARAPALSVLACPNCGCEFLAAFGSVAHAGQACPFCRLLERFPLDHRIQACFPLHASPSATAPPLEMLAPFDRPAAGANSPLE